MPASPAAALAACLCLLAAPALAAKPVKDGGFETPVVGAGSYQLFSTGDSFGGWTVVGASGNVAVVSGSFTQAGFTFAPRAGAQWLDLTGLSNTATGVQQTVRTVAGASYKLSFAIGNIVNPGGIFGTTSTVSVLIDGALVASRTNSAGAGSATQTWKSNTITFTAAAATTTIAFVNGDPSSDTSCGLDAVKLKLIAGPAAQ